MKRSRRSYILPVLVVTALTASGCGTRLTHAEVVRVNGGALATAASGQDGSGGAAGLTGGTSGQLGESQTGGTSGTLSQSGSGGAGGSQVTSGGSSTAPGQAPAQAGGTSGGAGGGTTGLASGIPIVIGNAGSYTGLGTSGLDTAKQALQAWAADLNAHGGLKGHPIKLVIKDDGSDASKARAQVQEMVEKDHVIALVANLGYTSSADAWQGYLEQKRVPAIGGNGVAKGWSSSPVFFSQAGSADTMYYGTVVVGAKFGAGKNFGSIVCSEDAACTNASDAWNSKGYAKKVGLNPKYSAEVSLAQPDYTGECLQAKSAGVQILAVLLDPATTKRLMASCAQQGYKPQYLLTYSEEAIDTVNYAPDILSAQTQLPFTGLNTASYNAFLRVWNKYTNKPPTPYAVTAWASAKIFERAAMDAKELTPAGIIDALYKYRGERFGGYTIPMSYGPHGTTSAKCTFYLRGLNGKWTAPLADKPVCW